MNKVLIVARYFGTRIPGLIKYLPEFGWQPVLLTMSAPSDQPPPPEQRVIRTPYRDALTFWKKLFRIKSGENFRVGIKKRFGLSPKKSLLDYFLTVGSAIVNYPDAEKGWKPFAVKAGDELLQREKIDAIISSSFPVTAHVIAGELKKRHTIPWIADFRDLWSQNHNYSYGPIRKWFDTRLELKTLSSAAALVTVSQPWANKLCKLHKGKTTDAITNGFDPAEVNDPPAKLSSKFTITYTGLVYPGRQDPSKLFAALHSLLSNGTINPDDIEVRFYGQKLQWIEREVEKYQLSDIVRQFGTVPKQTALEKQRESQLLLLLDWDDPKELGVYTGKIFEYLGARRPILATGGVAGDVVDMLISETQTGFHAPSVEIIKNTLKSLYEKFKLEGHIPFNGIITAMDKYSHRTMAQRFADVLNSLKKI